MTALMAHETAADLSHRERSLIRPAERHARQHRARRLQVHLALALVVARVDELHRPLDYLEQGHVSGGPTCSVPSLGARLMVLAGFTVAIATTCSSVSPRLRNLLITQVR